DGLDVGGACRCACRVGPVHTVQQLGGRDHRDRDLLRAIEHRAQGQLAPLGGEEHRGVDQDGHGSSKGSRTSSSPSTSCAKSGSTVGRLSSRSRNAAELTDRGRGGVSTATIWPCRSISTVSPAATRESSSEKPRLASVAVILIRRGCQINLICRLRGG